MIAFTKVNKAKASDVETTEAPDLPPGYKRTEVGVIHEEWTTHPLCNDILLFSGHHVLASNCNTRGDGTPYVTGPADFPEGQIKQTKFTTKPTTLCRAGDILITVKGSGSGTIVESDAEYCISRQLMAIRTTTWEPTFLMYSLLQNASRIKAASTGLIPGLSRSDILGQAIPLPKDPSEQRAIAEVLSDVDGLLGALEALIAKKRGIKQAAMQQLLTGKTRLPGFSGEWVTTTLGEAADIKNGATPSTQITAFWNGSIPWCTPTDITNTPGKYLLTTERSITAEGLVNCAASLLPAGALLLCSRATIGEIKIAASPVCTNQGFKSLICKDGVSDEFLYYLLVTLKPQMIERAIGSTFLEIGKRDVAAIEVSLPPCNEQHAIASILCDVDVKIAALERRRIKTRAIKQGMMQQLLTGQIRLVTPEKSAGQTAVP